MGTHVESPKTSSTDQVITTTTTATTRANTTQLSCLVRPLASNEHLVQAIPDGKYCNLPAVSKLQHTSRVRIKIDGSQGV